MFYESLGGDRKPQGAVKYWWDLASDTGAGGGVAGCTAPRSTVPRLY